MESARSSPRNAALNPAPTNPRTRSHTSRRFPHLNEPLPATVPATTSAPIRTAAHDTPEEADKATADTPPGRGRDPTPGRHRRQDRKKRLIAAVKLAKDLQLAAPLGRACHHLVQDRGVHRARDDGLDPSGGHRAQTSGTDLAIHGHRSTGQRLPTRRTMAHFCRLLRHVDSVRRAVSDGGDPPGGNPLDRWRAIHE